MSSLFSAHRLRNSGLVVASEALPLTDEQIAKFDRQMDRQLNRLLDLEPAKPAVPSTLTSDEPGADD